ncbi:hypothetical protein MMC11_003551 [Xylographa trunciseda]|nr:hypothetical protein [Xylographa trunciseda]
MDEPSEGLPNGMGTPQLLPLKSGQQSSWDVIEGDGHEAADDPLGRPHSAMSGHSRDPLGAMATSKNKRFKDAIVEVMKKRRVLLAAQPTLDLGCANGAIVTSRYK